MDGVQTKACIFAALILAAYITHQVTVGGNGAILAGVVGTLAAIGGYTVAAVKLKKQV